MSFEQLLLLILFVLVPLAQSLARRFSQRRRTAVESADATSSAEEHTLFADDMPAWPPAVVQPVRPIAPPEVPPRAAERTTRDRAQPLATESVPRKELLPKDRASLKRAMELVVILGPPLALEPSSRRPL